MYKNNPAVPNLRLLNIRGCGIAAVGPEILKKV